MKSSLKIDLENPLISKKKKKSSGSVGKKTSHICVILKNRFCQFFKNKNKIDFYDFYVICFFLFWKDTTNCFFFREERSNSAFKLNEFVLYYFYSQNSSMFRFYSLNSLPKERRQSLILHIRVNL